MSAPTERVPKESPVLFTGPMVRAILDDLKTQTRRVVKPQPGRPQNWIAPCWGVSPDGFEFGTKWLWTEAGPDYPDGQSDERRCPYGVPGDLLYVRETWASTRRLCEGEWTDSVVYRADPMFDGMEVFGWPWKPSIHMPKRFSRLWLRVTDVRVERVQEIMVGDMEAEGVRPGEQHGTDSLAYGIAMAAAWRDLWDSINAKRGFGWESNPWVWVVTFERAEAPR